MSFVSTGNKTVGSDGPAITTPPIVGENNGVSSGAAVASVTDAAEQMAEQAVELLFGELPEPSGLVKAAVAAAQAAAVAAGISDIWPCCVWIRNRNLSRWHWLNGQRNMQ